MGSVCNVCDEAEYYELTLVGNNRRFKSAYNELRDGSVALRDVYFLTAHAGDLDGVFCSNIEMPAEEREVRLERVRIPPGGGFETSRLLARLQFEGCLEGEACDVAPITSIHHLWPIHTDRVHVGEVESACLGRRQEPGELRELLGDLPLVSLETTVDPEISDELILDCCK